MQDQSWKAYIPNFKVNYIAILGGIDSDVISCDDIRENLLPFNHIDKWIDPTFIEPSYKFHKSSDGSVIKVKTNFFKVFFSSRIPVFKVVLFGKILFLNPFIQNIVRCNICQRFGPSTNLCKSKTNKFCSSCATKGHSKMDCTSKEIKKCVNCKRAKLENISHSSGDRLCPCFIYQRKIKKVMAFTGNLLVK